MDILLLMIGELPMKQIINSGIYSVDLHGTNNAEFAGEHPSLILRSIKNKDMYYIIPLTSFTKERWKKYRKLLCCRIVSINSIARIDKMQIIHKDKIPNRWVDNETFLLPLPSEIKAVYRRIIEYLELSVDKGLNDYEKFYQNYTSAYSKFSNLFIDNKAESLDSFEISEDNNGNIAIISQLDDYSHLSFDDIKRIIWSIIGRNDLKVSYNPKEHILSLEISRNKNNILTFFEWYDKMNLTEEHV
jgi:hypothetical protein